MLVQCGVPPGAHPCLPDLSEDTLEYSWGDAYDPGGSNAAAVQAPARAQHISGIASRSYYRNAGSGIDSDVENNISRQEQM